MTARHHRITRVVLFTTLTFALPALIADRADAITGAWSRIPSTSGVHYHSVIRDPLRDRLIAFGGTTSGVNSNEAFALTLTGAPVWEHLDPFAGVRPPARNAHSAIYDPVRDRMIVFGGNSSGGVLNDVWALSLTDPPTWTPLTVSGTPPSVRWGHVAIYDPVRDRMVVMGGNTGSTKLNDVWELSLAGTPAWAAVTPAGTPPGVRWGHVGVYDVIGDRLVIHGGINVSSSYSDTWVLTFAGGPAWANLAPAGTPPSGRWAHGAQYDPLTERMLVFGGYNGTSNLNDVWQLSLTASPAWSALGTTGTPPGARFGSSLVFDAPRNRMAVFGGALDTGDTDDLWMLALAGGTAWEPQLGPSVPARWRYDHAAVLDPAGHRMFVIGGFNGTFLNDVLLFELNGTPHWTTLSPTGVKPAGRHSHSATYDPMRNRVIVIGGVSSSSGTTPNDVWELSLNGAPAWTKLTPSGAAGITFNSHTAMYDPVNDRIVCYGGSLYNAGSPSPVWALSLAGGGSWSALSPSGTPPAQRSGHVAIYDAVRARMVIGGGDGISGPYTDLWALSLGASPAWTPLPFVNNFFRSDASAAYDADNDAMIYFGGYSAATVAQNDVWAVPLGATGGIAPVSVTGALPVARAGHSAVFDPVTHQMLAFGGFNAGTLPGHASQGDVFALLVPTALSTPPLAAGQSLRLAPARPNPAAGPVALEFTLRDAGRASLRVFDVRGRVVRTLLQGDVAAGPHTIRWQRDDATGRPVEPGLYFYELRSAAGRATGRVVLVR